tara:strand:+ start:289 stop:681 length:393 start_codon:yes stop_codon:yes gene_type:complete
MIVSRKKIDPCLAEDGHAWDQLEDGVQYRVVGISYDCYRIQANYMDWKPTLYPAKLFDVIDATVEPEWIVDLGLEIDDDQHLGIGFPEFHDPVFLEKFFDDEPEAVRIGKQILKNLGLKTTFPNNDNSSS